MNERNKYTVIKKLVEKKGDLKKEDKDRAAARLGVTIRHVNRMIKGYKEMGKAFFQHGNRGRKPAIAKPDDTKAKVIDLYKGKYEGANIRHFASLLHENEGMDVSYSYVWKVLMSAFLLSPKATKRMRKNAAIELKRLEKNAATKKEKDRIRDLLLDVEDAHPRRPRAAKFGEMIQMDASLHLWFGDKKTTLHVAVDDSTGTVVGAWFDEQETLDGYYHVLEQMLKTYGIPYGILTDRRTVFTYSNQKNPKIENDTCTQFGYACKQLGIKMAYTSVPQAKGRCERLFQTLQSRLPIELRGAGVETVADANEFLDSYVKKFNLEFATEIDYSKSSFVEQPTDAKINLILAVLTRRTVDDGCCIRYDNKYFRIVNGNGSPANFRRGTKVLVIKAFDGSLYCSVADAKVYALEEVPEREIKSKELDADYVSKEPRKIYIPPMDHPWRTDNFLAFVKSQRHHARDDADDYVYAR